jgi:hypothetical protein
MISTIPTPLSRMTSPKEPINPSGKTSRLTYLLPKKILEREPSYDEKGRIRDFRRKIRKIIPAPEGPIESDR